LTLGDQKFGRAPKKIDKNPQNSGIDRFSIVLFVANKIGRQQHSYFVEKNVFSCLLWLEAEEEQPFSS
jgi:hypothetical protein